MLGPRAERVEQAPERFDLEALLERPIVDYILGAEPSFGVFVLGYEEDPLSRSLHEVLQDGRRPGVHLLPAVPPRPDRDRPVGRPGRAPRTMRPLRRSAARSPRSSPSPSAISRPARPSTGSAASPSTGCSRTSATARRERLLPMGLTDGAVLVRDVAEDAPLTFDDVDVPAERLATRLWHEQAAPSTSRPGRPPLRSGETFRRPYLLPRRTESAICTGLRGTDCLP